MVVEHDTGSGVDKGKGSKDNGGNHKGKDKTATGADATTATGAGDTCPDEARGEDKGKNDKCQGKSKGKGKGKPKGKDKGNSKDKRKGVIQRRVPLRGSVRLVASSQYQNENEEEDDTYDSAGPWNNSFA